ncbi:PKD domain-containing protein, partial [Myxococcota bacterium]
MRPILLSFAFSAAIAAMSVPEVFACTVGCATGAATFDGRPIMTMNFDFPYGGRYWVTLEKPSSGFHNVVVTTAWVSGARFITPLNETGLSRGVNNSATLGSWVSDMGTVEMFTERSTIAGAMVHLDSRSGYEPNHNYTFIDGEGNAAALEVGHDQYWEYDVNNPTRHQESDFPYGGNNLFTVRSRISFLDDQHTEKQLVIDDFEGSTTRFEHARRLYAEFINNGDPLTPQETLQIARYGDPWTNLGPADPISGARAQGSGWSTLYAATVLGVNAGENGAYATLLVAMGQPDYSIFVPCWVAQDEISTYLDHDGADSETIRTYSEKLLKERLAADNDKVTYDEYINNLFSSLENNIVNAVIDARTRWFASGDQVDFQNTIEEMHQRSAWCAYHAVKSAYNTAGAGRDCNDIPVITSMNVTPDGSKSISCSATATDSDGIKEYSWKFGDGSTNVTGAGQTHTYSAPGTYMVSVIAKDNHTDMAANVMFKWVTVTAVCTPDCAGKECGDDGCGGSCGSCVDPFLCQSGTCECPEGLEDCSGTCVDLQTNNDHCGECDNGCETDAVCILGVCSPTCGDTICDGADNCENCPSDCPTAGDEVCCSGVLHSGECCDDQDCSAPDTCIGWSCLPPSTCENDADG